MYKQHACMCRMTMTPKKPSVRSIDFPPLQKQRHRSAPQQQEYSARFSKSSHIQKQRKHYCGSSRPENSSKPLCARSHAARSDVTSVCDRGFCVCTLARVKCSCGVFAHTRKHASIEAPESDYYHTKNICPHSADFGRYYLRFCCCWWTYSFMYPTTQSSNRQYVLCVEHIEICVYDKSVCVFLVQSGWGGSASPIALCVAVG